MSGVTTLVTEPIITEADSDLLGYKKFFAQMPLKVAQRRVRALVERPMGIGLDAVLHDYLNAGCRVPDPLMVVFYDPIDR